MKFQTYNEQVPLNTVNAQVQGAAMPKGFNAGAGMVALAKGIGAIAAGIQEHNERQDKATLMEFMNDMDSTRYEMLHNQETGYLNKHGKNAMGISQDYEDNINKVMQEKMKQYKFKTEAYKLAAMDMSRKANRAGFEQVDAWQQKQAIVTADTDHATGLDLSVKLGNASYASPEVFQAQMEAQKKKSLLYASTRNFDENQTALVVKDDLGTMAANGIITAIRAGDTKSARDLRREYGTYLSAEQASKIDSALRTKQNSLFVRNKAEGYMAKGYSKAQVLEALKNERTEGEQYEERNMPSQDIEDKGLAGTNKNLVSAAKMLNGWAFNTFGKDIEVSGGKRSKQHNAAVGGTSTSNHLSGNALDINISMFDEDQRKQIIDKAKEMGFNSDGEDIYHDKGSGLHLHLTLPEGEVKAGSRPLSIEEQDEVYKEFEMLYNRNKAIKREELEKFQEDQDDVISNLVGKPDGLKQWDAMMNQYIGDKNKYKVMKSLRSVYFGGGGGAGSGAGKALTPYEQSALTQMLFNGDFHTNDGDDYMKGLEYVNQKWPGNPKAIDTYKKLWNDKKSGSGAFKYNLDGVVEDAVGRLGNNQNIGHIKRAAKSAAIAIVNEYRDANNGKDMPYPDLVKQVKAGIPAISYGKYSTGGWFNSEDDLMLSPNKVKDAGIKLIKKSTTGDTFAVYYEDGRVEGMSGDDILRKVEGK